MKSVKVRAYQERLKGHDDVILAVYAPDGPESQDLYSVSKDGKEFNRHTESLGPWKTIHFLQIISFKRSPGRI